MFEFYLSFVLKCIGIMFYRTHYANTNTKQKYVIVRTMHVIRNSFIVMKAQIHKSLFCPMSLKMKGEVVSTDLEQQMMTPLSAEHDKIKLCRLCLFVTMLTFNL